MILSRRHVPWWTELTEEEAADVFALAHRVGRRLQAVFAAELVTLYARGRRIPHTHIFLVPTCRGEVLDRFFSELEEVQEGAQELAALCATLPHARRLQGGSGGKPEVLLS